MRKTLILTFAAALALAACGKKDEEAAPVNNLVEPPVENVIVEEPDAVPPPAANNAAEPAPAPAPDISEDQQIQDDAAATGMTARLPADGESSPVEAEAHDLAR